MQYAYAPCTIKAGRRSEQSHHIGGGYCFRSHPDLFRKVLSAFGKRRVVVVGAATAPTGRRVCKSCTSGPDCHGCSRSHRDRHRGRGSHRRGTGVCGRQQRTPQVSVTNLLSQLDQLQNMTVEEDVCAKCHANYDPAPSFATDIKFSHGYHVKMQCSRLPYGVPPSEVGHPAPDDEDMYELPWPIPRPTGHSWRNRTAMRATTLPSGSCSCPYNNTLDWAGKGHVARATADTNSDCMMCHTQSPTASTCHEQNNILWAPTGGWAYDPGEANPKDGCYACHGDANAAGPCRRCEPVVPGNRDHRLGALPTSLASSATPTSTTPADRRDEALDVNAGLQCGVCHQQQKDPKLSQPVTDYEKSIHAQQIRDGNYNAATCASCHGGHFIYSLDTVAGKARMHSDALRVCGICHTAQYARSTTTTTVAVQGWRAGCPCVLAVPRFARHPAEAGSASTINMANLGDDVRATRVPQGLERAVRRSGRSADPPQGAGARHQSAARADLSKIKGPSAYRRQELDAA